MLNAELIRRGYAHAYTRFPFRHVVEFRQLERTARGQGAGLWASCHVHNPMG
jgi:endonuclease YncB( thermonuclease family)